MTKREIVEALAEINEMRKLNSAVAGEMISGLIDALSAPPVLPAGWEKLPDGVLECTIMRISVAHGIIELASRCGPARLGVTIAAVRAALELAEEHKR